MASHEARRGRPKGSGLDDRSQLERITGMLEHDPNLKPTTAIKAIGVTDPSTIRRLREKLKIEPVQRDVPHGADVSEPAVFAMAAPVAPAASPASVSTDALAVSPPDTETTSPAAESGLPVSSDPSEVFIQWCALGLSAASSALEAQMAVMNDLLETPQVQCVLRQQILLNEGAKALCPKRSDI
jgi:hypothetical protein